MTNSSGQRVNLGPKEWIAIAALILAVGGSWVTNARNMERLSNQIESMAGFYGYRLDRLESKLDRAEHSAELERERRGG